jgi:hypothetical protein
VVGYNTTVVIMNDALSEIEADAGFGKRLAEAIKRLSNGSPETVAAFGDNCVHCNAALVIETHHAGHDVLVSVGGNTGRVVQP